MAYGIPEVNEFEIKCEICNKWFKKITSAHMMKKHSITIPEYKEQFGFCRNQSLEAFYLKGIRQKYCNRDKSYLNLVSKSKFKKGDKSRLGQKRRPQELIRLKKYTDRMKGEFLAITPADVVCIFDLFYKLKYPKDRIANVMRVSEGFIRNTLKRKDVYDRWKSYYRKEVI